MDQKDVIKVFVAHLGTRGHPGLAVERWPDEENRDSPDIDAIAGPFAIEHTSIDTIANQRRDSASFMKAAGILESELSNRLPFRLRLSLPYDGIQSGQNWPEIKSAFEQWILESAPLLPDGTYAIANIPKIPFEILAEKSADGPFGVFFARSLTEDDQISPPVQEQFHRKMDKLATYKKQGKTTILLVESDDIALMNDSLMIERISDACSGHLPAGVDQIWSADTAIPTQLRFFNLTDCVAS